MTAAEPVIIASVVATLGSLCAQLIARLRWVCKPDKDGKCVCLSGCTESRLDPPHETLTISEYELAGRQVLILSSNDM